MHQGCCRIKFLPFPVHNRLPNSDLVYKDHSLNKRVFSNVFPKSNKTQWRLHFYFLSFAVPSQSRLRQNVIQGDVVEWLVWMEERAHHWCTELTVAEHVDPHSCSRDHHRCIQHRVKVPMQVWKLNEDHHCAPLCPTPASSKDDMEM